jgi:hypothetical protein
MTDPYKPTIEIDEWRRPLTYLTCALSQVRDKSVTIQTPDEFTDSKIAHVG